MEPTSHHLLRVSFSVVLLFSLQGITSYGAIIGAIVDLSSRVGKEEKVAMEMAIEDFQNRTNQSLVLQVKDSQGKPIHAAVAATRLIHKQHVQAILGPSTWEEASLVSEIGSHSHTPILSFANSPSWANTRCPYLIQASPPSQHTQMKAVASIIQSSGWRRVVVIYEDISSSVNGVIPHLHDSLDEVGSEISVLVGLPPIDSSSSSSSLYDELENLKRGQYRVIVVHVSLPLALRLFQQAKRMGMLEKEYVWITTDTTTSLVHAINSSYIASMQGVLGVKSYFNETEPDFHDFYLRFKRRFGSENPEEPNHEPGIFALQAYDATRAVALAMNEYIKNEDLLEKILSSNFDGLGGKVHFSTEKKLPLAKTFQIINVIGKSYKEIGFWSDGFGFSNSIGHERESYNASMENLGQVFWPGEARYTPKGWALPTNPKRFKVAVPNGTLFNLFLQVGYDKVTNTNTCNGFACDIFKETIAKLPYDFPYEFHIFGGTFNEMIDQVHLKNFDAAIGGIAITAARCKLVDFSQPHTDTSLVMIVPVQSEFSDKAWMFLKPFTNAMWLLTAGISVYNGFVVWMIERDHCSGLRGSVINQIGALLWLAFSTLFSRQGDNLHSNLSRMATVVWLFLAIVIMQSYTANLASMLTIPRLEPMVADIETLKYTNAMVGCTKKSFVASYLADVLLFSHDHLKNYSTSDEIAQALRKKEIAAVFLEAPWAKLFLARYCKSFIAAGPTYKIGGYGFAFQKGSMMISDVNEALLNVTETGKLLKLETDVTATEKCVDVELDNNVSLSPSSFWVLFILSGGTSTIALMVYMIHRKKTFQDSLNERETIWVLMFRVLKYWLLRNNQFSRKVSDVESPKSGSPPNGLKSWSSV